MSNKSAPQILVYATQHLETGGIESHIREFCLNMSNSNVNIDLVILNPKLNSDSEKYYKDLCSNVYLNKFGSSYFRFLWLFFVMLSNVFKKYDALYTNGQGSSIYLMSKLVNRKKWVHHHHTAGDINDQKTWTKKYIKAIKKCENLIGCSHVNAASIKKVLNREVDVLYCFSRRININDQVIDPDDGIIRLGYYGRLISAKGVDYICKLSDDIAIENLQFHIWGEGEDYPKEYFDDFENVFYNGTFSNKSELEAVIASLDGMLLLSSYAEGLPISLLEAMSAGLPWLATDKGGIPDIALDEKSTRVISAQSNYDEIKLAVIAFVKDLKAGVISRQAQLNLYNEKFSTETLISEWLKILELTTKV